MQERKKAIKRELVEKGKKKGYLTYKEITDAFFETDITADEQETLYDRLEKEGIELTEDLDKELVPQTISMRNRLVFKTKVEVTKANIYCKHANENCDVAKNKYGFFE